MKYDIVHADPAGITGPQVTVVDCDDLTIDPERHTLVAKDGDKVVAAFVSWSSFAPSGSTTAAAPLE